MKEIFLILGLLLGVCHVMSAQDFEHFVVKKLDYGSYTLQLKKDTVALQGVSGLRRSDINEIDGANSILENLKKALLTLPKEIKEKLKEYRVGISLYFNAKGEVLRPSVFLKADPSFLTESQWLQVWQAILSVKVDLTKFDLADHFEWAGGFSFVFNGIIFRSEDKGTSPKMESKNR